MDDWPLAAKDAALLSLPVSPYLGLNVALAAARAREEGQTVRVVTSLDGPSRRDLVPSRINVEVDQSGVIVAARAG